jgi:hypothetical protein
VGNQSVIVAVGFRVFSLLLGVPSFVVLIDIVVNLFVLKTPMPQPDNSAPLDVQKYGVVALLDYGARGIGAMFGAFSALAVWVAQLFAALLFVVVLFALLLYFTGRGIAHHAMWARVMGMLICVALLLACVGLLSVTDRTATAVVCMGIAVSLYTIWVLGWRYA